MTSIRGAVVLGLAGALAVAGCVKKPPVVTAPPAPIQQEDRATAVQRQVTDLQKRVAAIGASAQALPGRSHVEFRDQMARVFNGLSEVLPLVAGENPGMEFRQRMNVLKGSADQLTGAGAELSVRPAVDSGLRAARQALLDLGGSLFSEDTEIPRMLETANDQAVRMDRENGTMFEWHASEAIRSSVQVVARMAQITTGRLGATVAENRATAPATAPMNPATSLPAAVAQPGATTPAVGPKTPLPPATAVAPDKADAPDKAPAAPATAAAPAATEPVAPTATPATAPAEKPMNKE